MNAKNILSLFAFLLLAASQACAPAGPTTIAVEPRKPAAESRPQVEGHRPMPTAVTAEGAAPPAPEVNTYQDYGVNPETAARYDSLSTFALDVDTASFAVTRRYLEDGHLPPYEAVRVEEFVNAFDQGYEAPRSAAFSIYADGALSPEDFEEDAYILRFGVQGYRVDELERKPAVLTFVIDVSGSMAQEDRLELVKRALRLLVERLDRGDSVAIVVYGDDARAVLHPTPGNRRSVILDAIDRLEPEGSTNAEAGLRLGYRYAAETFREDAINRVILCSDGVANVGSTDAGSILEVVGRYVDQGITLTSIGVGMGNFNDVLLEQLADRGNGNYAYVDSDEEARRVFVDRLTGTLQVIARDARVQVDFNSAVVETYRLLGYENRTVADEDFRNDSVDAGELGAGHTATALYAVRLKAGEEGRVATVQLRWEDPETGEIHEINGNFNTWDLAGRFEEASARYQLAVTVAQFAEVLRESPYAGEISLDQLARRAARLSDALVEDEQVAEFAEMVRRAARLRD